MHSADSKPLHVQCSTTDDRSDALALVLSHLPADDRSRHVAAWTDALENSQAHLCVGYRGGELTAATLVQLQPGRTAVVLPPRAVADEPRETLSELMLHVADDLANRGVQLAQALLATDHGADVEVLRAAGFGHASELLYLVSLAGAFPTSRPQDGLEFVPYVQHEHGRLATMVERTYEGSRDFPSLDKVRDIADVLAGYRAIGKFDPGLWSIACARAADVGCLLLTDDPGKNTCELLYMGIVPSARGRGYGVALARFAQWLTGQAGRERLTAAVDAANGPAISAYAAAGFTCWDRRSVFLRVLS